MSLIYYFFVPCVWGRLVPICSSVEQGWPHLFTTRVLGVINLHKRTFSGIKPPFISPWRRIGELAREDNDFKLPFSQLILRRGIGKCSLKSENVCCLWWRSSKPYFRTGKSSFGSRAGIKQRGPNTLRESGMTWEEGPYKIMWAESSALQQQYTWPVCGNLCFLYWSDNRQKRKRREWAER